MKNESYFELNLSFNGIEHAILDEIQQVAITHFGAIGVEQYNLEEYRVDEILGERSYSGGNLPEEIYDEVEQFLASNNTDISLKIFFRCTDEIETFLEMLNENDLLFDYKIGKKTIEDWNENWRKNFKPINVDENCVIVPSWQKTSFSGNQKYKIYIYPGMGFGTGNHETTLLCLQELMTLKDQMEINNVIDFGCGSGILGIAVKKIIENSNVDLFDIDQSAIENTIQNVAENEILEGFDITCDQIFKKKKTYNLILANILAPVLIENVIRFNHLLELNGTIIMSGILNNQKDEVIDKFVQKGHVLINQKQLNDWSMISMRKINASDL